MEKEIGIALHVECWFNGSLTPFNELQILEYLGSLHFFRLEESPDELPLNPGRLNII